MLCVLCPRLAYSSIVSSCRLAARMRSIPNGSTLQHVTHMPMPPRQNLYQRACKTHLLSRGGLGWIRCARETLMKRANMFKHPCYSVRAVTIMSSGNLNFLTQVALLALVLCPHGGEARVGPDVGTDFPGVGELPARPWSGPFFKCYCPPRFGLAEPARVCVPREIPK